MSEIAGSLLGVVNNPDNSRDVSNDHGLVGDVNVDHHHNQLHNVGVDTNLNVVDDEVDEEDHIAIQDPLFPFGINGPYSTY